jgi:hypothetical protein
MKYKINESTEKIEFEELNVNDFEDSIALVAFWE